MLYVLMLCMHNACTPVQAFSDQGTCQRALEVFSANRPYRPGENAAYICQPQ